MRPEARVVEMLAQSGRSLAVAESVTGGLLSARLTAVEGASRAFRGGVVTYDDAAKASLLGVDARTIAAHGVVSAAVADEMAVGVARRFDATFGLATTGYAGPGGPSDKVGRVYVALSVEGVATARSHQFGGDRTEVRDAAVEAALTWLLEVGADLNAGP